MYRFSTYKRQYKANLKLALPVVMTQLGQILVQVADNVMVGRYGGDDPTPLAATSFGGSVFFILFIAGVGIALGLTPLIGELYAQGDRCKSSQYLQNGLMFYTSVGISGLRAPTGRHPFDVPHGTARRSGRYGHTVLQVAGLQHAVHHAFLHLQAIPRRRRKHPGRNGRGDSLQPDERRLELDFHLRPPRIRRTGRHRCGARHPRIAHRHADHDYRLFLQKTEIPRLSSGILAPQLFGQNDPHIAAYGPSDLPADVSRSLGLRRHQYHDGLAEQNGHQRQPDRHDLGQLRLHDRDFDRCRHDHPHLPLLRRPQA